MLSQAVPRIAPSCPRPSHPPARMRGENTGYPDWERWWSQNPVSYFYSYRLGVTLKKLLQLILCLVLFHLQNGDSNTQLIKWSWGLIRKRIESTWYSTWHKRHRIQVYNHYYYYYYHYISQQVLLCACSVSDTVKVPDINSQNIFYQSVLEHGI